MTDLVKVAALFDGRPRRAAEVDALFGRPVEEVETLRIYRSTDPRIDGIEVHHLEADANGLIRLSFVQLSAVAGKIPAGELVRLFGPLKRLPAIPDGPAHVVRFYFPNEKHATTVVGAYLSGPVNDPDSYATSLTIRPD